MSCDEICWKACDENSPWLVMAFCEDSRHYPWCCLCGKWAEEDHLRGWKCAGKRERFNVALGPFLAQQLAKGASSEAGLSLTSLNPVSFLFMRELP